MEVSLIIGRMPFLWLLVDDVPGKASSRGFLEKDCIGLLSNWIDPESTFLRLAGWEGSPKKIRSANQVSGIPTA